MKPLSQFVKEKLIDNGDENKGDSLKSDLSQLKMKIFLSHSSLDKPIIDEFVDKILKLSCGVNNSNIVYTSREETGVGLGESIPAYIKENLQTSDLVFCFISENYKKSEVCLNEMGAAWVLDKRIISLLLPDVTFDSIGWLTSFKKAIRIDNAEGLDCLYDTLQAKTDIMSWNRYKKEFLSYCKKWGKKKLKTEHLKTENKIECKNLRGNDTLQLFDIKFNVRAVTEGEYQYQLDFRLHANSKVHLKEIYINNSTTFVGNVSQPKSDLLLPFFVPQGVLELNQIAVEKFKHKVFILSQNKNYRVLDYKIEKDEQKSFSCVGVFCTIRECDGYCECPINNWFLKVTYNIDEYIEVPISLTMLGERGYFFG